MNESRLDYEVRYTDGLLGLSALEEGDRAAGVAFGRFRPAPAYERVRPIFRRLAAAAGSAAPADEAAVRQYYRERDALGLELVDPDGHVVPRAMIHIVDFEPELGADAMQLEVIVDDPSFWRMWG